MILLYKGKANTVRFNGKMINGKFRLPEIIMLEKYIPLPYIDLVPSRKNIYLRDNHTCQYCGKKGINLTVDHVIPRSRGGGETWGNMVASCARCNNRKGDKTVEDAGLKLNGTPYRPSSNLYLQMTRIANVPQSWHSFFFGEN